MVLGEIMIVAGIGCRSGVTAHNVSLAIEAALQRAAHKSLDMIATAQAKGHEAAIAAAAAARKVPLVLISQDRLEAANARTVTRSDRSIQAMQVGSVAEAAALAAAGRTARLLVPRIVIGAVTCALAQGDP
jgi:cobalt-precorrin 5A hydrolase